MARLKRGFCVVFLIQFFSVFTSVVQNSSGAYVEQFLESPEVCSSSSGGLLGTFSKKKLFLKNFPNNTVRVKMTRWPEMSYGFANMRCRFQVQAPKKHGVMVIIQEMNLRTKKQFSCQDYVKFEQDDGLKTGQICGELEASDFSKSPAKLLGPRFFYDPQGQMDVVFSTGDNKEHGEESKPMSISMIFTAYSECSTSAIMAGREKQCSALRGHSCIPSDLYCDNVINCGFNDDDFGSDEKDCQGSVEPKNADSFDSRSMSIYVFAITSIATLLIVVLFVLIVCCCLRKFTKRQAVPSTLSQQAQAQHEAMEFHMENTGPPSAPPLTLERLTNEKANEDKDLPPPYHALFPPTSQSDSMKK